MQKSSIKNFVCSFVLSLFAVAAANKAIFRETSIPESKKFSDEKQTNYISLFAAAADTLETVENEKGADISTIEELTARDTITITSLEPSAISKQTNEISAVKQENEPIVSRQAIPYVNLDLSAASEIILEKEPAPYAEKTTPHYQESGIVYADISDTINDEEKTEQQQITSAKIIYTAETDENFSNLETKAEGANKNVIIASSESFEEESNLIIPIEENTQILHTNIDVMHSANAKQIAMLEPGRLVSAIQELDAPEEKTLAEADLKQNEWTQMSEKEPEISDSPWVVAKGNKFAKNRAIVEHFAKTEDTQTEENQVGSIEAEESNTTQSTEESPLTLEKELEEKSQSVSGSIAVEKQDVQTAHNALSEIGEQQEPLLKEILSPEINGDGQYGTKTAYQMIQNLLIPIPEDIRNDANLVPELSITPDSKGKTAKENEKKIAQKTSELNEAEKQSGLFKSITSWFSEDKTQTTVKSDGKKPVKQTRKKSLPFFSSPDEDFDETPAQIMPAELRLSFQPNRAEISGQTLRWIHAFADNARDNDNTYIEVRIDGTSSFALQQKRLNLLSTIFANRGVDFRKINIVFTSREPNSFIIRNMRYSNHEEVVVNKKENESRNSYYRPW